LLLPHLICVVGPTASGKTQWAIALSKVFGLPILSFDSRQFYSEMQIGTARPVEELREAPHHFIGHLSVTHPYSAAEFAEDALELIQRNKFEHAILVGGSGMYLKALLYGLDSLPSPSESAKSQVETLYKNEGLTALQNEVKRVDELQYSRIDTQNPRRLMRVLEVFLSTGRPFSDFIQLEKAKTPRFPVLCIGPEWSREELYSRINRRVIKMIDKGLIEEVKGLLPHRDLPALQTVGYTEVFRCLDGEWNLDTTIEEIQKNTRRYAKRQLTWFNNQPPETQWLKNIDQAIARAKEFLGNTSEK
jgi:tRNA dimethylallyltransferase